MQNSVQKARRKKIKRFILLIVSTLISAIVYNLFLLPIDLVTGGAGGIATITNYVYDIDPAIMVFLISVRIFLYRHKKSGHKSIKNYCCFEHLNR